MDSFLSTTNLAYLWGKLKDFFVVKSNTVTIYSGSTNPSSSLGKDGDIYIIFSRKKMRE